jgi:hypothetical protein
LLAAPDITSMGCAERGTVTGHLELALASLLGAFGCFSDPRIVESSQDDWSTDSSGSIETGESGSQECVWIRYGESADDDIGSVTTDTWIDEEMPMMNNGADDDLRADGVSGQGLTESAFLRFDASSLPAGTVTDARLSVSTNEDDGSESSPGSQFSLYLVGEPWVEAEANWLEASAGVPWSTAGCAAAPCRSEIELVQFEPTEQAHRYELPFDPGIVQGWRDEPDSNYGIMLATPAANGAHFHSSESGNEVMRPALEVRVCP